MHEIEPYYNWRTWYCAEEDQRSPFYGREYSEFEFTHAIYNYCIHPQWDEFGSPTLFAKILYTNYLREFTIIELFGEWNDCLNNDIMWLKREVIEPLQKEGVSKFILVGENVLNFHYSDDCYYEEWFEEVEDVNGWIAFVNFSEHVLREISAANIDSYIVLGGQLNEIDWRTRKPENLFDRLEKMVSRRLLL